MSGRNPLGVRCILLGILELSIFQSVITVLHNGHKDGYALPRPFSGCGEHWVDFKILLKYPNISHATDISTVFKLAMDTPTDDVALFEFCMQNKTIIHGTLDDPVLDWPAGKYCIYSVGRIVKNDAGFEWALGDCPSGFKSGVTALPFKSYPGQRMVDPTSPFSLTYPNITLVHYCCSTNGDVDTPIDLGMMAPFILMPYGQSQCQEVQNMESDLQHIEWPAPEQRWVGSHPYSVRGKKFYYCYYQPLGLGMEHDIVIATVSVALGTPALTMIVICLCKLRAKLITKRKQFKRRLGGG